MLSWWRRFATTIMSSFKLQQSYQHTLLLSLPYVVTVLTAVMLLQLSWPLCVVITMTAFLYYRSRQSWCALRYVGGGRWYLVNADGWVETASLANDSIILPHLLLLRFVSVQSHRSLRVSLTPFCLKSDQWRRLQILLRNPELHAST